jgi:hypothetical protein
MKKVATTLFAMMIIFANLLAQVPQKKTVEQKSPEERTEKITKRLTKELLLSVEQQQKIKPFILKREQDKDQREKLEKAEKEKLNEELKLILTPEQYQLFIEKLAAAKDKHKAKVKSQSSSPVVAPTN